MVYTEGDAKEAFAALAETKAGCLFEGVKVEGTAMRLRWKPSPSAEVRFTIRPAGCGEGQPVGALLLEAPPEAVAACPLVVPLLQDLAARGELPAGTAPLVEAP